MIVLRAFGFVWLGVPLVVAVWKLLRWRLYSKVKIGADDERKSSGLTVQSKAVGFRRSRTLKFQQSGSRDVLLKFKEYAESLVPLLYSPETDVYTRLKEVFHEVVDRNPYLSVLYEADPYICALRVCNILTVRLR